MYTNNLFSKLTSQMKRNRQFKRMNNKILFLIIFALSISYSIFYIFYLYPLIEVPLFQKTKIPKICKVPILNPFDKSILKFIKKPDNLTCSLNGPLIDSDLKYLYINEHLLPAYGVHNIKKMHCCYRAFERDIPAETKSDDNIVYLDKCKPFYPKVKIDDEFVEVFCKYRTKIIYHDMHSFVPLKKNRNYMKNTKQKINVLIFGIDALSNMNFQRQMPKTKKYIDDNLSSILMNGFNKIADNTFPNLLPILTGKTENEINDICWKATNMKFDKCPIIWNNYSNAGYITAFAEDTANTGLFHYYNFKGFHAQPTHYYWRTFILYAEKLMKNDSCLGPRPSHKVLLDYTKKFTATIKDQPFFGFFFSVSLSHDCLNCPSLSDDDYVEFFDGLKRDNVLNNTVVVLLSDHGFRTGHILETYQGYLEERLPLLYFIFPPWFLELYPSVIKNMRDNSNRLTSNFDVYETLKDLLDLEKLKTKYSTSDENTFVGKRGISLFSLVPKNRTCEMAGIASHWCTCKIRRKVYIHGTTVQKIADFIVSYINNLLMNYKDCATLILDTINAAFLSSVKQGNNIVFKEYTITLKTKPNDALFEGTVQCIGNCFKEDSYKLSGTISRLNRYENQSHCISHHSLRMYCYCT